MQVSRDENNKHNATYEDHNITYGTGRAFAMFLLTEKQEFVSTVKK